jgi:RimJ/RimL family protein N-acetyltransferase
MPEFRQPSLQNTLVLVRPLQQEDFDALFEVAADPLIWEQHPAHRYKREVFEVFFSEAIESKGALIIFEKSTGNVIGSSRLQLLTDNDNAIEIGWTFLGRRYWGGAYNGSIKKLMINHAFQFIDEVIFFIDTHNFRSQKSVLKIGAQELIPSSHPYSKGHSPKYLTFSIHKDRWNW